MRNFSEPGAWNCEAENCVNLQSCFLKFLEVRDVQRYSEPGAWASIYRGCVPRSFLRCESKPLSNGRLLLVSLFPVGCYEQPERDSCLKVPSAYSECGTTCLVVAHLQFLIFGVQSETCCS